MLANLIDYKFKQLMISYYKIDEILNHRLLSERFRNVYYIILSVQYILYII